MVREWRFYVVVTTSCFVLKKTNNVGLLKKQTLFVSSLQQDFVKAHQNSNNSVTEVKITFSSVLPF